MQQANIDVNTITPEMLACLFLNIFRPETEIINQSTAILKKYLELPTCIPTVMKHMATHTDLRVRLLACICLKKKLPQHWDKQAPALQNDIKRILLVNYTAEVAPKVKENIAYLIGSLSVLLTPNNSWPELFPFVFSKCNSENLKEKEDGMQLLLAVCECLGNLIAIYLPGVVEILGKLFESQHSSLQLLGIKTFNCITTANITVESLNLLSPLVVSMMEVVMHIQNDESIIHEVFDNFSELVDIQKFLVPHLEMLLTSAMAIGINKSFSSELRNVVLAFVQSAVATKGKVIKKNKELLMKILQGAFEISSENEDKYEEDEDTPVDAALDLLEQYAIKIPNTLIYPLLMSGCESFLKSPDPGKRRAALLIIGTVSKGVEDPIKNNLEAVVNVVLQSFSDPEQKVQEAAVIAFCYFADNLSPEIVDQHAKILPKLLEAVHSKTENVRTRVFYAIETFCENLSEKEIVPYIQPLLQSLISYLDAPQM